MYVCACGYSEFSLIKRVQDYYRTRRFIGEELILAIGDFLKICQYIKSFNYCFSQTNLPNITLANKSFCTVHVCSSLCKLDIT